MRAKLLSARRKTQGISGIFPSFSKLPLLLTPLTCVHTGNEAIDDLVLINAIHGVNQRFPLLMPAIPAYFLGSDAANEKAVATHCCRS